MFPWDNLNEIVWGALPGRVQVALSAIRAAVAALLSYLLAPLVELSRWMTTTLVMLQQVRSAELRGQAKGAGWNVDLEPPACLLHVVRT